MTQELDFEAWLAQVNQVVFDACGLGIEDIPDYNYWDNWDSGVSAEETAQEALANAGWQDFE